MRAWLIFAALMTSVAASAQVNVEPITSATTAAGWSAKGGALFGLAGGNTAYVDLSANGALRFLTIHPDADAEDPRNGFRDRFVTSGNLNRRNYGGGRVLDGRFVHVRYTRMQWLRFGGEVYTQVGNDRLLLQKWRILGGAGVRVVMADSDAADIVFGTGYMYEWEDREIGEEAVDPRREIDHRNSTYLALTVTPLPEQLTVQNTVYVQPRWDKPSDLQLINDFEVDLKVTQAVSFNTSLRLRYDSDAPSELVDLDYRLLNGLSVTL
ncbi:MAG: hypothetical protein ACJAZO_002629 [Myxococcota bacterium]|jgi:hypothetical protein